jgi:GT2 family glycosyltransferase
MIAFGVAITDADQFQSYALPGIELAAEPDSEVMAHQSMGSLFRNYNLMLDMAAELPDLEALVLVHQDTEIADDDLCDKVRQVLSDPDVALIGCAGAVGVRSIAWWEGAVTWASFTHRYDELGGGDFPAMTWSAEGIPPFAKMGEVDSIDGFLMVLSPWAVRELRFDETLGMLHGYDFDFCCQVRAAGRKVVTADLRAIHHHSLELISDPEGWMATYIRLIEKWEGKVPHVGGGSDNFRMRALRAEAEAAYVKGKALSNELKAEAVSRLKREMEESTSWRITRPLRSFGRLLRRSPRNGTGPAD